MDRVFVLIADLFGLFSKVLLSCMDMGAGLMAMVFSKLVLEVWTGRELPAYTFEGGTADWSH